MISQHRIDEVRFSELWCRCQCGEVVRSQNRMNMPEDWLSHRAKMGERKMAPSQAARSNPEPRRSPFNVKSHAIQNALEEKP